MLINMLLWEEKGVLYPDDVRDTDNMRLNENKLVYKHFFYPHRCSKLTSLLPHHAILR